MLTRREEEKVLAKEVLTEFESQAEKMEEEELVEEVEEEEEVEGEEVLTQFESQAERGGGGGGGGAGGVNPVSAPGRGPVRSSGSFRPG